MTPNFSKTRGFAILYAVLMVSIVLTISLTLLDISYKQLVLSSINKESKLAYYAAVNALNCANYWDLSSNKPFGDFVDYSDGIVTAPGDRRINCTGTVILESSVVFDPFDKTSTFDVNFPDGSTAHVVVTKGQDPANTITPGDTFIRVDGYNTADVNNPRRVQRSQVSE